MTEAGGGISFTPLLAGCLRFPLNINVWEVWGLSPPDLQLKLGSVHKALGQLTCRVTMLKFPFSGSKAWFSTSEAEADGQHGKVRMKSG